MILRAGCIFRACFKWKYDPRGNLCYLRETLEEGGGSKDTSEEKAGKNTLSPLGVLRKSHLN